MALNKKYDGLEIAIIGMSAQFPQSADYRQYWQNLAAGRELLKTFSDEELIKAGVPEEVFKNELYVRTAGVVHGKDCFDHAFFGYSAEEAALMDPQIRLFHEHCWKALEDAGYSSSIENRKIGLFAGASANDNWKIYVYGKSKDTLIDPFYLNIIMSQSFVSTLVSYKLNLRGPSFYIDTACSTSLATVHLACRSLLTRESTIALAGGVCIRTRKGKGYFYNEGMIASKDGRCRSFDADASGSATGEGVGVVVLKRLNEALKDRDHIYAVIRSTAANNDGSYKVGYTAPSVKGQAECIVAAHKMAGIDASHITYIEAHGTATNLGDPVEIRALNEAFNTGGKDKFCAIGSVKSNMGHLDAAAGVAGLIKTVLCLQHKQIPASLHFKKPNPEIEFHNGPFYVNTALKEWLNKENRPLCAGVNSLGMGGTNIHAILEEAPIPENDKNEHHYKLLTVSAKTENALTRYLDELKAFLLHEPSIHLADMAYTLQVGRKHFVYRKSIVYTNGKDLMDLLEAGKLNGQIHKSAERSNAVVFLFPGQGSQYENMGKGLYINEPLFREEMDKGFLLFEKLTGECLKEILFPEENTTIKINQTRYTQPALFLLEYALARYLMAIGILPKYMIGHSIGEYVAACISELFGFEDALRLVIKRGELMNRLPAGSMVSISVTAKEATAYVKEGISIAAINGPEQVVLSGDHTSVELLINQLNEQNIPFVKLHTSHAFHSAMQDPILDAYRKEVERVTFNKIQYPFISNLTGTFVTQEEVASPAYWVRHLRETVQFSAGISTILSQNPEMVFIEVGAGRSLTSLLKQHKTEKYNPVPVNLIRPFKETADDLKYLTDSIGQLWAYGIKIDWNGYYGPEKRNRISLPTYSFEPTRFPAEVNPFDAELMKGIGIAEKVNGHELKNRLYYPSWKRSVLPASTAVPEKKHWLLFSLNENFSHLLTAELRGTNDAVVEIHPGSGFEKASATQYRLNLADPDHLTRLFIELKNDQITVTDVLYAWGMRVDAEKLALIAGNQELDLVYFNIIKLIQSLTKYDQLTGMRMVVLTNGLHRVTGNEEGSYAQSLMLGLTNVIPQEYPISSYNVDIDLNENKETTVQKLAAELMSEHDRQEHIVAIRNRYRWVPDYEKNTQPVKVEKSMIKREGVYLITGGLGNVGFLLAKHLIERYQAKVLLIGRKDLAGPIVSERVAESAERYYWLKERSKNIKYIKADVADLEALKAALLTGERELGTIQGVIHAAGAVDNDYFQLIEDITVDKVLTTFAPKVKGIENLYAVFQGRMPDFVWITSSIAGILGGLSFSAYSAANLYMDHFISSKSAELDNWRCVDLSGLAFTDEEIRQSPNTLKPVDLIALFEWSLSIKNSPVVMESPGDILSRIRHVYDKRKDSITNGETDSLKEEKAERPALSTRYIAPETETEKQLTTVFENFFGIEKIGIEDDFFELGGDSLKAMMLLKRIKKEFNINLVLKEFLVNVTIKGVSAKIDELKWLVTDVEKENEIII